MEEKDNPDGLSFQLDLQHFAVFDTFNHEEGREAHLNGKIAAELMQHADELLSKAPVIEKVELLASKGL